MQARPRFTRELVVVPTADAWLVDGLPQLQVLRGDVTRTFLARLLSLLDGSRDIAELSDALGVDAARIRSAVELLSDNGLVEDGVADTGDDRPVNIETLGFFRRVAGAMRHGLGGVAAYRRLAASSVIICGHVSRGVRAGTLDRLLRDTGVGDVTVVNAPADIADLDSRGIDAAAPSLLIAFSANGEDGEANREIDAWCATRGVPWLRAVLDEKSGYADIGPLFRPGRNPCYRCFTAVHRRAGASADAGARRSGTAVLLESLIATEVLYLLTAIGPSVCRSGFRRYELERWRGTDLCAPRLPDCDRCHAHDGAMAATAGTIAAAVLFEDYVGRTSGAMLAPRLQQDIARAAVALSRQTKRLPDCRQHVLDNRTPIELTASVLAGLRPEAAAPSRPVTLDDLTMILQMTAGISSPGSASAQVKRWAATGGNLGSVELFAAVRDVDGLAPGFYCYQPVEHSLASLDWRAGGLDVGTFMRRVVPNESGDLPAVMVLLTGAFHRLNRKYNAFGYRLLQLDAGAAMSQLQLVAASLEIASRKEPVYADDVIEAQLHIDPPGEQCTGVVSLGGRAAHGERYTHKPVHESARPVRAFQGMDVAAVLELVRSESRTVEGDWCTRSCAHAPAPSPEPRRSPGEIALPPPPLDGGRRVGEVLMQRRSVRRFAADPISLDQVSAMARYALWRDDAEWGGRDADTHDVWVLAWRVDGLAPGVYLYDSAHHRLSFSRPAPPAHDRLDLLVQPEFADAPVQVWMTGDLATACARYGAWGHRQLLLQAGAAAHRSWFAGLALGLQGALVAGIVPDAARSVLGFDIPRRAPLIAVVAGHEAR